MANITVVLSAANYCMGKGMSLIELFCRPTVHRFCPGRIFTGTRQDKPSVCHIQKQPIAYLWLLVELGTV